MVKQNLSCLGTSAPVPQVELPLSVTSAAHCAQMIGKLQKNKSHPELYTEKKFKILIVQFPFCPFPFFLLILHGAQA
ncbi:rCG56710, isoform CRA_a [Rattus norvegicus]|uniref:RCG56710, isoform CRA_a n=1 Tax=Rattus norvegicus TaxID=10116 RepID=A6KEV7_RAT|nr:rCG56710, isoform CRA_a [Rattus norvegicus]EDL84208.1 rCG56710, isoform CRA_a [Rattus norvegicus]